MDIKKTGKSVFEQNFVFECTNKYKKIKILWNFLEIVDNRCIVKTSIEFFHSICLTRRVP